MSNLAKTVVLALLSLPIGAAITYHNSASTPADNGTNATATVAVTPPASMTTADLVHFCAFTRDSAGVSMAISQAGGQSWNSLALIQNTNISMQCFWSRFNGTWGANPSIAVTGGTSPFSATMHIFRPTNTSKVWSVDVAQVELDFTAGTTPFTKTITGVSTVAADTVTIAGWTTADDNTWGSLSGTGWAVTGAAQYRNTSGTDQSATFAHKIQTSAGSTGNVSKNQATLGGRRGYYIYCGIR